MGLFNLFYWELAPNRMHPLPNVKDASTATCPSISSGLSRAQCRSAEERGERALCG
jgi:hypothetical protein